MSGIRGSRNSRQSRIVRASEPYNRGSKSGEQKNNSSGPVVGRRLFVGNLSFDTSWQDLKDHMGLAGTVARADILSEPSGRSKGCGIVEYATEADAQNAVQTLHNSELKGRLMFVREDREDKTNTSGDSRGSFSASGNASSNGRDVRQVIASGTDSTIQPAKLGVSRFVYVGNLSWETAWQDLKDHMKAAGNVARADVMLEPNGRSKGCGIVEYATVEEANNAIVKLHNTELLGRLIFVREDRERSASGTDNVNSGGGSGTGCRRLYVGNLAYSVRWQDLKDFFKQVCPVAKADVAMESNGQRSKGYGIVEFATPLQATNAMNRLNNAMLHERPIVVREDKAPSGRL